MCITKEVCGPEASCTLLSDLLSHMMARNSDRFVTKVSLKCFIWFATTTANHSSGSVGNGGRPFSYADFTLAKSIFSVFEVLALELPKWIRALRRRGVTVNNMAAMEQMTAHDNLIAATEACRQAANVAFIQNSRFARNEKEVTDEVEGHLQVKGFMDFDRIPKSQRKLLRPDGNILVEWDGMLGCERDEKRYLFLVEVTGKPFLSDRVERTRKFLLESEQYPAIEGKVSYRRQCAFFHEGLTGRKLVPCLYNLDQALLASF